MEPNRQRILKKVVIEVYPIWRTWQQEGQNQSQINFFGFLIPYVIYLSGFYVFFQMFYFLNPLDGKFEYFVLRPPFKINLKEIGKKRVRNFFCGPSNVFKNISRPINTCLKYLMAPS